MTSNIIVIQYLKLPVAGKRLYSLHSFTHVVLFRFCFVLSRSSLYSNESRLKIFPIVFFFFLSFPAFLSFSHPLPFIGTLYVAFYFLFFLHSSKSLAAFPYRQPHLLDCLSRLRLFFPFNLQCFPLMFSFYLHFSVLYIFSFINNQHLSYSLLLSFFLMPTVCLSLFVSSLFYPPSVIIMHFRLIILCAV